MAEQNSYDFWTRYSNLCLKCKVCPLKSVIKHMRGTSLTCPVERIRSEHWQFLLSALSVDNSLTDVRFKSDLPSLEEQKELWKRRRRKKDESYPCPYGYSSHNISDICKYSARLLTVSQTLQTLVIENLPITADDAVHLAEGLRSSPLKEFAFRCYPYSDEVIEIVCSGLLDSDVLLLDFSACNLSLVGLKYLCNVIVKHKERRTIQAFPDTLRYRLPMYEEMMGLTRINLNGNNIGDKGVEMICEVISDDRWIQALDLQYCGITNEGARAILGQISANNSMQIVDLRLNKIAVSIADQITLQLGVNSFGKLVNYTVLPVWKPKSFSRALPVRTKLKTKVSKKYSTAKKAIRNETRSLEHAFRISCEILERNDASKKDAMVQTNHVDEIRYLKDRIKRLELTVMKEMNTRDTLLDLSEKFKDENLKLCHINENLRRENASLRQEVLRSSTGKDAILIDKETYSEIKLVFEKFQRFLKMMKENGLWGLVSTIGVAEYENTKLKAVSSDSKVRLVDKDDSSDECPSPIRVPPSPKPQRCCSCGNPECISNQKSEKDNYASNVNHTQKISDERSQLKNIVDKAKVTKVFKELRETYTNCDFTKQVPPPPPRITRKRSLGDVQAGLASVPTSKPGSLRGVLNRDIPQQFKDIKTRQDLYEAVKSEMERIERACLISVKNQTDANNKSPSKNVSSQTAAVESLSNFNYQIVPGSATFDASQKDGIQSNSSSSTVRPSSSESLINNALSKVSNEWDEHVKKDFIDHGLETAAGAEVTKSIFIDQDYFQNWATSKVQEYLSSDIVPEFSNLSLNDSDDFVKLTLTHKESVSPQGTIKSTSSRIFNLAYSPSDLQKIKSNEASSNIDSSIKSYLESVSDASTDKDVKSLSGSELYEPVKSDSVDSKSSNKSSKAQKAVGESGGNPAAKNSVSSNSSSKSSKRSQKQRKNSNQNASGVGKTLKDNVSSPSVPSLSDITTVSSHSLNTDSVMDKLSESEKGLS